jgi:hypothetical protein
MYGWSFGLEWRWIYVTLFPSCISREMMLGYGVKAWRGKGRVGLELGSCDIFFLFYK